MLLVAWGEHDSRNTGGAGSASSINLSPIRVFQEEAGAGGEGSDSAIGHSSESDRVVGPSGLNFLK